MATSFTFRDVSFILENGHTLFDSLSASLTEPVTALVGPNGSGKSVLARILAGQLAPAQGTVNSNQAAHYVPQQWSGNPHDAVLQALGLTRPLDAMKRIELGQGKEDDFDLAEPWWDWQSRLEALAEVVGWQQLPDVQRPIGSLSGGEQFRILWLAALLSRADILIFDEPSNHLDSTGRAHFQQWLRQTSSQVLLISHDRDLLNQADTIWELTAHQLHRHAGNFDDYFAAKQQRWQQQQGDLDQARKAQKASAIKAQQALEKQQQRAAHGKQRASQENWTKLERNAARESAQDSQGKQLGMRANRKTAHQNNVDSAQQALEWFEPIGFTLPQSAVSASKITFSCDNLICGIDDDLHPALNVCLPGAIGLHLTGRNGCGKSVLLKTLMHQLEARAGSSKIHTSYAYLGQHFYEFSGERSAVENFLLQHPGMTEKQCRDRLAWLRLRNTKADIPFAQLSGGEQLKTALAIKLLGPITPQLLLLDEPTNHLDLDSVIALEKALAEFHGAMILVSHDHSFVARQRISHRLELSRAELSQI